VVQRSPGVFGGHIAPGWDIAGNANGGYLLAIAGRALTQATGQPELVTTPPPDLPAPGDCLAPTPAATFPPPFMGRVDLRLHPDDAGFATGSKSGSPVVRGWFRLRGGEPVDSHALVVAVDAFPPRIFNADRPVAWTPTVELTGRLIAQSRQLALVPRG
jgi:hypothetical protein